jgi:hypothetical protein
MTKIRVPFKHYVYENAVKVEKIGFYEDELSEVYNVCKQCLSIHDRHSRFCQLCSDEHAKGNSEGYKSRLEENQKALDHYEAEAKKEGATLSAFGKVVAILNGSERTERKSSGEVRKKGKAVVSDDIQGKKPKNKRTGTKAGVV